MIPSPLGDNAFPGRHWHDDTSRPSLRNRLTEPSGKPGGQISSPSKFIGSYEESGTAMEVEKRQGLIESGGPPPAFETRARSFGDGSATMGTAGFGKRQKHPIAGIADGDWQGSRGDGQRPGANDATLWEQVRKSGKAGSDNLRRHASKTLAPCASASMPPMFFSVFRGTRETSLEMGQPIQSF